MLPHLSAFSAAMLPSWLHLVSEDWEALEVWIRSGSKQLKDSHAISTFRIEQVSWLTSVAHACVSKPIDHFAAGMPCWASSILLD